MNIEKTISEQAVSDILTPMLESQDRIVTEDVAPLFDQATGLDTPPASGTVTTTIEESRSVISAIIRKAWTATLTMLGGASVISYIAAAYTYLRNRLQGNETYGIPDRRSEISASSPLAANLALLNDRKIGGADVPDGMSLVRLICDASAAATVTEITDNNEPWEYKLGSLPTIRSLFPNASKILLNVDAIIISADYKETRFVGYSSVRAPYMRAFAKNTPTNYDGGLGFRDCTFDKIEMPALKAFGTGYNREVTLAFFDNCQNLETVDFPEAEYAGVFLTSTTNFAPRGYNTAPMFNNCPNVKNVLMPKCKRLGFGSVASGAIEKLELGVMEGMASGIQFDASLELIILHGAVSSLDFSGWNPTDKGATFLSNFRDYIANRLTDNGSGKTLTLSQAVRNAIHAAESTYGIENILISQKGWTISPAPN